MKPRDIQGIIGVGSRYTIAVKQTVRSIVKKTVPRRRICRSRRHSFFSYMTRLRYSNLSWSWISNFVFTSTSFFSIRGTMNKKFVRGLMRLWRNKGFCELVFAYVSNPLENELLWVMLFILYKTFPSNHAISAHRTTANQVAIWKCARLIGNKAVSFFINCLRWGRSLDHLDLSGFY